MGRISEKLAERLGKSRKLAGELRGEAFAFQNALETLERWNPGNPSRGVVPDPLHAVYAAVQGLTSVFSEQVSRFPEFAPYYQTVFKAQDAYMPSGPPMSPLTGSYFTTWAFFDLAFGPDRETIGTCLLDLGEALRLKPDLIRAVRLMSETRMGVYEHAGIQDGASMLRELITDDVFECRVPAGYPGARGELWYARLCPPIEPATDHVVFTTPYVLTGFGKADWTAYLSKRLVGLTDSEKRRRLHELLKYGRDANFWNEFVFQAYHHHRPEAIYLAGLPDSPESRPHAN